MIDQIADKVFENTSGHFKALVAQFNSVDALMKAVKAIKNEGFSKFDVHTPYAVHGLDEAMGLKPSMLGWIASVGAVIGGTSILALQCIASGYWYKIVVSGKPLISLQAFVPITFEVTILMAAIFTVLGMFILNKLPQFYHPLFYSEIISKVGNDVFAISIDASDPMFDKDRLNAICDSLNASELEWISDEQEGSEA